MSRFGFAKNGLRFSAKSKQLVFPGAGFGKSHKFIRPGKAGDVRKIFNLPSQTSRHLRRHKLKYELGAGFFSGVAGSFVGSKLTKKRRHKK